MMACSNIVPALILILLMGGGCRPGQTHGDQLEATVPQGAPLRRLTAVQFANVVHDALGAQITIPNTLAPDLIVGGFASLGASQARVPLHAAELYDGVAGAIAAQAVTQPAAFPCAPQGDGSACATQIVNTLGQRLWRRPLQSQEVARYVALIQARVTAPHDFWSGVQDGLSAMLQSPYFLFRNEAGHADPTNPHVLLLDDYELASRLAFFLWNSAPDEALLQAAASQTLTQGTGLQDQAKRLLNDPKATPALLDFFTELYELDAIATMAKNQAAFPEATDALPAAMQQQILRTIQYLLLDNDGDYRTLFTSNVTYMNQDLAPVYGVSPPADPSFVQTTFPAGQERAGLLGQAGILALFSHPDSTSPTRRGKFVREVLLCTAVPAPPPNVDTTFPSLDPNNPTTTRQRLEIHRSDPSCNSCHQLMDPIGLALEKYDGDGKFRSTDDNLPIDATGAMDDIAFVGDSGLATVLHDHPKVVPCAVSKVFQYAMGRSPSSAADVTTLQNLQTGFAAHSYSFRQLVLQLATSDAFRQAEAP